MKRYIFGLIAIVTAAASVAFTKPVKDVKPFSATFYFTGNPLTSGEVPDETKWSTTSPGNSCSGLQNKACSIVVDNNQTESDGHGGIRLKSSLNIQETPGAGGTGSGYIPVYPSTGMTGSSNRP